jgi:hypothetical protein
MKIWTMFPILLAAGVHVIARLRGRLVVRVGVCAAALALGFVFSPRLLAQTSGTVTGHLTDPSGAILAGADVTLTNTATTVVRSTKSTGAGDYTFTEVPPGPYSLQVTHPGFKTTKSDVFDVQVQQSVRLDFTLQVGAVTDSIDVTATGALLQADNASLGTVVENAQVEELPLPNGRNYLSLAGLASNVNTLSPASGQAGSRLGGDRSSQSIAVGGQRIMFDYYTLDGTNNTDPDFNTYIALPSLDGVQEFKVQTGVYSAEFGHEASQVNVLSKSGTNNFHGTLYDFIRNNYVDAEPYWFPERQAPGTVQHVTPFKYNDYGFELDGPIWIPKVYNGRDKFFFMVDDEWYKTRLTNNNATAVVPTAAEAAGNFQGDSYTTFVNGVQTVVPVTIYNPATAGPNGFGKTPFVNNTLTPTPQSTALIKYLGTSATAPTFTCSQATQKCQPVANYQYTTTNPTNRQSLTVRGDYNQSARSQFSFRYSAGNEDIVSTGLLGAGSKIITNYYQYMGSNTFTFSPSLLNEFRFGYSHFYNANGLLSAFTNDVVDSLHIPGLAGGDPSTWGIPAMSFGSGPAGTTPNIWSSFGDLGGDGPYVINDPTWQIVDNVTLVKGKHSLRMGFEYNHQIFNQLGNQFSRGQFSSEPLATALQSGTPGNATLSGGDALADFLLGDLYQSTVAVQVADANYVRNVEAAYVDDTYKLLPNLTLSAGLRYELTPPWNDTIGNNFNVNIPVMPKLGDTSTTYPQSEWPSYVRQGNCAPADVYQGLNIRWTTPLGPAPSCSNGTLPNGPLLDTQYKNFAPRLGISYSPTATLVVRAGYGIFYTQDIGNAYFDMARNIAGRVTNTNTDSTPKVYGNSNLTWNNAAPAASGGTVANLGPGVALANAVSHRTSYTEQFLFDLQQQIGKNWSVELGYQGAVDRHLYGFLNVNQATPYGYIGNGAPTSVASRTPFANMGGIQLEHDEGTGNYNSGSIKVNRRFSNGVDLIASYTYSKALDDTSGVRNQGNDELYPQNSRCIPCEYGPSAFDVRNRVVVSGVYELPIGPGKLLAINNKALYAAVGGWVVSGTFTHQTGQVATPLLGFDNSSIASPFGNFDRPNLTGVSPYLTGSARTVDTWVNKAAYQTPTPGFFGDATRGSFTGPGLTNLDASVHKDFHMPYNEKHALSIRFEAFNALNHPNWTNPNLSLNSSTFGQVGAGGMRTLQLAAKYQF